VNGSQPPTGPGRGQAGRRAGERVAVLGVRHHGPGSARSVLAELDRLKPQAVLIEGPADAGPLLALAAAPGMAPPVALLAYAPDAPRLSAFWPYAVFSPEWQALTWAASHDVPVRFCDLPAASVLAMRGPAGEGEDAGPGASPGPRGAPGSGPDAGAGRGLPGDPAGPQAGEADEGERVPEGRSGQEIAFSLDPIGEMAAAAGYDDPERWWDDVVEARLDGASPFPAIAEAMGELRLAELRLAGQAGAEPGTRDLREQRREAHMRQVLRATLRETDGVVAVVCGAWHAPALASPLAPAARDAALLRGLPRRKVALAWVPWTHSRLATASGYGAGVASPGWYHHLFTTPGQPVIRWMTRVGAVLRAHDLPVSSAHVIEAVRLAEALATLRCRPLAGLAEVSEAAKAVMCDGSDVAAAFVHRDLVVGELLGSVPAGAPPVPLDADLRARARALKLKIDPVGKTVALDLRKETDRGRSAFLHQLTALGITWGTVTDDLVRGTGTFHETWSLRWRPELAVDIIDAAAWGTTVATAASERVIDASARAERLAEVTAIVEQALLVRLPDALGPALRALDARAAAGSDVADLMTAVPALVRAVRYGTARGTGAQALTAVVLALTARACAGLPAAVGGLADDAARGFRQALDGMHAALALFAQGPAGQGAEGGAARAQQARNRWLDVLAPVASRRDVHGLIAGRVTRLLADAGTLAWPEAATRLHAALSAGASAAEKAAWAEGFLSGGGLLLVHDAALLGVLDDWVASLDCDDFLEVMPLLRRTFGEFSAPERSSIGDAVRHMGPGRGGTRAAAGADDFDAGRAAAALATIELILGGG
jgi:hypothetical protein